jgi:nudix-type nucleoside diphosphatase (YffH/AdpP family)
MTDDISDRVRLRDTTILSDDYYTLRKTRFDFRRSDGRWQTRSRESYDIGDAAAVLPYDAARGLVLLIRQFRWPVFDWGLPELLVEAPAGKLDGDDPVTCARKEAMEEAGVAVSDLRLVNHCFMSAGAVKERLSLFLAGYDSTAPRARGGGHAHEGEDIETLEMPLDDALAMIASGAIVDAKTIILLQAAKLDALKAS